jgi:hypothetical protein
MMTAEQERAQIVAWLREPETHSEIINLTAPMRNRDVIHALNKVAWILENGVWGVRENITPESE